MPLRHPHTLFSLLLLPHWYIIDDYLLHITLTLWYTPDIIAISHIQADIAATQIHTWYWHTLADIFATYAAAADAAIIIATCDIISDMPLFHYDITDITTFRHITPPLNDTIYAALLMLPLRCWYTHWWCLRHMLSPDIRHYWLIALITTLLHTLPCHSCHYAIHNIHLLATFTPILSILPIAAFAEHYHYCVGWIAGFLRHCHADTLLHIHWDTMIPPLPLSFRHWCYQPYACSSQIRYW